LLSKRQLLALGIFFFVPLPDFQTNTKELHFQDARLNVDSPIVTKINCAALPLPKQVPFGSSLYMSSSQQLTPSADKATTTANHATMVLGTACTWMRKKNTMHQCCTCIIEDTTEARGNYSIPGIQNLIQQITVQGEKGGWSGVPVQKSKSSSA